MSELEAKRVSQMESQLETLPDERARALFDWRLARIKRKQYEAVEFLRYQAQEGKKTIKEIESLIESEKGWYDINLEELKAEARYERLHERLMAIKKLADIRVAY